MSSRPHRPTAGEGQAESDAVPNFDKALKRTENRRAARLMAKYKKQLEAEQRRQQMSYDEYVKEHGGAQAPRESRRAWSAAPGRTKPAGQAGRRSRARRATCSTLIWRCSRPDQGKSCAAVGRERQGDRWWNFTGGRRLAVPRPHRPIRRATPEFDRFGAGGLRAHPFDRPPSRQPRRHRRAGIPDARRKRIATKTSDQGSKTI